MSSFIQKENKLCLELRKYCDLKGEEANLQQLAILLNKLGMLYMQKSPDKISLIQSAALLNAAIVR